ncbi:MAG: L-2-amino-thiazoline-4-carboxylic acid hydrolase [Alphaproteobacteria bacterium]|nr:L-2-amino-thiazoline-4-carboxylic acid hydrolase [Alphaproteobacteria bacterium]
MTTKNPDSRKDPQPDEAPISHLQRRRIESRVLLPFIEGCRRKFGDEATRELVTETIRELAVTDGAHWAETYGNDMESLGTVARDVWAGGGSLDIDVLDSGGDHLDFNVTRCRYAEFWRELGMPELGSLIHCNRDFAMVDGFNPDIELTRTQTVMGGASHCDFRFRRKPE